MSDEATQEGTEPESSTAPSPRKRKRAAKKAEPRPIWEPAESRQAFHARLDAWNETNS